VVTYDIYKFGYFTVHYVRKLICLSLTGLWEFVKGHCWPNVYGNVWTDRRKRDNDHQIWKHGVDFHPSRFAYRNSRKSWLFEKKTRPQKLTCRSNCRYRKFRIPSIRSSWDDLSEAKNTTFGPSIFLYEKTRPIFPVRTRCIPYYTYLYQLTMSTTGATQENNPTSSSEN